MKIDSISSTQLNMISRCPQQYYYRYVMKLKIPPAGNLIQGRVYHKMTERNYSQKITSGNDLKISDLKDIYVAEYEMAVNSQEIAWQNLSEKSKLKDEGVAYSELFGKEISPAVIPARVEERAQVEINYISKEGKKESILLVAVFDLIDTEIKIIDQKLKSKSPTQSELDKDIQMGIYSMFYRLKYGEQEKCLVWDTIVKNKEPVYRRVISVRGDNEVQWLRQKLIAPSIAMIEHEIFPAYPNGYNCDPRYCGYYDRCRKGTKKFLI